MKKKINFWKKNKEKRHWSIHVNPLSLRPRTWNQDNSIDRKLKKKEIQSPTNLILKYKIEKNNNLKEDLKQVEVNSD